MKKELTKSNLLQIRSYLAALNIVGLPTTKSLALLKLLRKVNETVAEVEALQKELIEKYDIKVLDDNKLDTECENFKEYSEVYFAVLAEVLDLAEYCVLTEEEAMIAVQKIDAPLSLIDSIAQLLTVETEE